MPRLLLQQFSMNERIAQSTMKLLLLVLFFSSATGQGNVATEFFWRIRPDSGSGVQFGSSLAIARYFLIY